jgi:hypothetical protein
MLSPFNKITLWEDIKDPEKFVRNIIFPHYEGVAAKLYLQFHLSEDRLEDTFSLWRRDVDRVQRREYDEGELDQYKLAGYLCYWLRRMSPIVSINESSAIGLLSGGTSVMEELFVEQEFLYKYANEFMAFDVGLLMCRNVQIWRELGPNDKRAYVVAKRPFLDNICEVLKTRNMSPHAMYMVYHALSEGGIRVEIV